jgi:hypothetical protein
MSDAPFVSAAPHSINHVVRGRAGGFIEEEQAGDQTELAQRALNSKQ